MKLARDEIFYINELYSVSGAHAKDCLIGNDVISFLVGKKDVGKAIGKNAVNIKKLSNRTKKHIEILEHSNDVAAFLKKALYKVKAESISKILENGKTTFVVSLDSENRRKLMGSAGRLKRLKEIAKRNYKVDDIKIR